MKIKLKLLLISVVLGFSGVSQAAFDTPNSGNGSLILMAWDPVSGGAYTRDLGVNVNDWLPNDYLGGDASLGGTTKTTPGLTLSISADPLFTSIFDAGQRTQLLWNIVGGDALGSATPAGVNGFKKILTTLNGPVPSMTNGGLDAANGNQNIVVTSLNVGGCGSSCPSPSGPGRFNDPTWGDDLGGQLTGGSNAQIGTGASLNFMMFTRFTNLGSASDPANLVIYASSGGLATWTLLDTGELIYAVPAEVPIPAAMWLLASGLLTFVGVARRKNRGVTTAT